MNGIGYAALLFLGTACAPHAPMPLGSGIPGRASPSTICPFGVRGVRVDTRDTLDGVDVSLAAFGCNAAELRHRAHAALGSEEKPGEPPVPKPTPLRVAHRLELEDVDSGIVLHLHAVDPHQADAVRAEVRQRIEAAADEQCE